MKNLNLIYLSLILISCSVNKIHVKEEQESSSTEVDSISNYFLFKYIDSLDAQVYDTLLDSIKNGLSNDFFTLRMAYTKTGDYSPYDPGIDDSLKKATEFVGDQKYSDALKILIQIQEHNFVQITSHLYCGYIYLQTGDTLNSNFHYNAYTGLLNSILYSGDGNDPKTAYLVISTVEEYDFLNWFNLQTNRQSLINADGYSFDLMKVTDRDTGEKYEIYFNVEPAINTLKNIFGN